MLTACNKTLLPVLLWLATGALPVHAQTRYRLTFPEATQHYVQVEARYMTGGEAQVELFLPTWTPGDYQVQNYSQRLDRLRALGNDGQPLGMQSLSKSRWRIHCEGQSEVTLHYRVKGGKSLSISSNYVDSDRAVLQGAATFLSPVKPPQPAIEVQVELPSNWPTLATGLPPAPGGRKRHFLALDFDQLVDCPIVAGSLEHQEIRGAGVRHSLVYLGPPLWDRQRAARDVQALVQAHHRLWGFFPFAQDPPKGYWFLNLRGAGWGGLEHRNSTCIGWTPLPLSRERLYSGWLELISHEYFHTWNGKNLRPIALGPFDYEAENLTPSLWIVEGLTHYYDKLLLVRAGLTTETDYLKKLSAEIYRFENTRDHSLSQASLRTWEPVSLRASYRSGGAVVGFLLDRVIRQSSGGRCSLDEVMREAYRGYSGVRGYTEEQFEAVASQVAGIDLGDFFRRYVHGTEVPDFTPTLLYYGLRWQPDSPYRKQLQIDPAASPESRAHWEAYLQGLPRLSRL